MKVWDEVQVKEYEYTESEDRWTMEIISVEDTEYWKVYIVDDGWEREVCREEDALWDDWFLSWLVIDSVYWQ